MPEKLEQLEFKLKSYWNLETWRNLLRSLDSQHYIHLYVPSIP